MTRGEAIKVVSEALVNVMAGQAVFVEDPSPLYEALLTITQEDAETYPRKEYPRGPAVKPQRGYHDADGWSVPVR